ncbi:MAG: glycerol-3-phosphate acyltransferase [Candidatus Kapabacteria bacterium]|nr:glycerol-3-phosphate acyltransferase [Candidatus Kapabacteria bacterium]
MTITNYQVILISYLLGAIPFAFILTKYKTGNDIRDVGTGSIGAMNTFETTNSRLLGFSVFLLDAIKASIAVLIARQLSGGNMYTASLACVFAMLGHNYSVFMGFKGGRGLAPAVGGISMINPLGIFFWALMWVTSYFIIKKDVHIANVSASLLSPVLLISAPNLIIWKTQTMGFSRIWDYITLFILMNIVIIVKHIEPIKKMIDEIKDGEF